MKKVKLVIALIILVMIALIGYQNLGFLVVKHQFGINLMVYNYQTPEIHNGILLLVCLVVGFLLALFSSLKGRWKSRKAIKELTAEVASCREKAVAFEKELADLKANQQSLGAVNDNEIVSDNADVSA